LGERLIPGAAEFLSAIRGIGAEYVFITNNSSKNRFNYVSKLSGMGIATDADRVMTSGQATAIYLKKIKPGASIFLLGTPELAFEFSNTGFLLVDEPGKEVDFVVLGFDTTLTYAKLWAACDYIRYGIPFIATHPDLNCPLEEGRFMPDTGAMIAFIKASTGREPIIIGKPYEPIIDAIRSGYSTPLSEMVIIGDRLYTDIQTGINAGITTVLVLSGETTAEMYESSKIRADYVFGSVAEIVDNVLVELQITG
jgi:HAD superfamily hydrolase (TIGR01450 family)